MGFGVSCFWWLYPQSLKMKRYAYYVYWNPNVPCFGLKRPSFGGKTKDKWVPGIYPPFWNTHILFPRHQGTLEDDVSPVFMVGDVSFPEGKLVYETQDAMVK